MKGWLVYPTYAQYYLTISRQGNGVIVRLILPITILLLLSGLTFWITFENRVNTTITLMLSVSALYIVILGNIPMVGYLTIVDKYVFAVSFKYSSHFASFFKNKNLLLFLRFFLFLVCSPKIVFRCFCY